MTAAETLSQWLRSDHAPDRNSDIRGHLPMLYDAARGRRVIELGVDRGVSTAAFLAAQEQHGGLTLSVDNRPCVGVFAGHQCWRFVQADSLDETIVPIGQAAFDVLFIDTDHSYERTLDEMELWTPVVRRDGVLFLHDAENPLYPGVMQAAIEFAKSRDMLFTVHRGSFGMAELRR